MGIKNILDERGNRYGEFADNAKLSQALKYDLIYFEGYNQLSEIHKEALDNICQKIARIVNGDPNYEDNWVDIIGYSQLVLNEIKTDKTVTGGLKV